MKKQTLSIVIVTFNSEKQIKKCLESIANCNTDNLLTRIVIIDNSPNINTIKKIRELSDDLPPLSFTKNKNNSGFAKAINQGIKKSQNSDFVLLLNPDTILRKNAIKELVGCSNTYNAGICGGKTVDEKGKENGSYFRFPNMGVAIFDFTNLRKLCLNDRWHKYFYYQDRTNRQGEYPVDAVTGGFMLLTKETIKKNGLLDEEFFMYLEDVDYCMRAKRKGIKIFHTNKSVIIHIGGASSKNKDKIRHNSWLSSRKKYFLKNHNLFENIIIQPLFLVDDLIILFLKYIRR